MKRSQAAFAVPLDEPVPKAQSATLRGFHLHAAGLVAEAAACYRDALLLDADDPDALHLLGLAATQMGDPAAAVPLIRRSLDFAPANLDAWNNLGNALLACGDAEGAAGAYRRRLEFGDREPGVLYNLANALVRAGRIDDALPLFDEAAAIAPGEASIWLNRGNALLACERWAEAEASLRAALERAPTNASAANSLGVALEAQDRSDEALQAFQEAVALDSRESRALNNLGAILVRRGEAKAALSPLEEATRLAPDDPQCAINLAGAIALAGDLAAARSRLAEFLLHRPDSAAAWRTLGDIELNLGRHDEAVAAYLRAESIEPGAASATCDLGIAYAQCGRLEEAIGFFETRLQRDPRDAAATANLGLALKDAGDLEGAIQKLRAATDLDPKNAAIHSNLLLCTTYSPAFSGADLLAEAEAWAARHAPEEHGPSRPRDAGFSSHEGRGLKPAPGERGEKIRIGFLSADFHAHPAGYLFEALFPRFDRGRFEIYLYANQTIGDEVTRRIVASAEAWRGIHRMTDAEVDSKIRADEIDVLVDLLGHTNHARLGVFARRPAPVSATWLGYFATTGMRQIDYILADRWTLPPDEEPFYTERPARLPGCLYVFQPPRELGVEVAPLPMMRNGYPTFGCFHNTAKITPEVVRLWCEVLRAVPGSRLLLNRWPFASASVRARYAEMFRAGGVDPERIEMRATKGREAYFLSYADVDVALDTFPFGGGTTTSEALWSGVPLVALPSPRFVGHMSESILHTIGAADLICASPKEYVAKAAALVADPVGLAKRRAELRERVEESPLCDLDRIARDLEATFSAMLSSR